MEKHRVIRLHTRLSKVCILIGLLTAAVSGMAQPGAGNAGDPQPDPERGNVVKAYVVLTAGKTGDAALVEALQAHVRGKLAPYEYPKEIEFIDELPMTTTGKVQRRVLRERERQRAPEGAR